MGKMCPVSPVSPFSRVEGFENFVQSSNYKSSRACTGPLTEWSEFVTPPITRLHAVKIQGESSVIRFEQEGRRLGTAEVAHSRGALSAPKVR